MKLPRRFCLGAMMMMTTLASAAAQDVKCVVEPLQGATLQRGAVASMRVTNTGSSCSIVNYGAPSERSKPADSGNITKQATHGKAEFIAPEAKYTPEPGYVGSDEFQYEAFARGRSDQQVRLKVLVKILVVAP